MPRHRSPGRRCRSTAVGPHTSEATTMLDARQVFAGAQDKTMREKTTNKPHQIVLVFQGGGALGAYQAGVYQALHEAGIELDWVIGTSIGAINASLIAGNAPENRLERLEEFWRRM